MAVRLLPWSMIDKNDPTKKVTGITLYQESSNGWYKIPPYYTKNEPKDLPQMKQVTIKGKTVWDDFEMMDFLFKNAQNCYLHTIIKGSITTEVTHTTGTQDEDLPF